MYISKVVKKGILLASLFSFSTFAAIPNWYLTPPATDGQHWYGEAKGSTVSQARDAALATIGKQIQTTVSSVITTRNQKQGSVSQSSFDERVKSVSKALDFADAAVAEQARDGDDVYLLMKVNKAQFFDGYQAKVDQLQQQNQQLLNSLAGNSGLAALQRLTKLQQQQSTLVPLLDLLGIHPQHYSAQLQTDLRQRQQLLDVQQQYSVELSPMGLDPQTAAKVSQALTAMGLGQRDQASNQYLLLVSGGSKFRSKGNHTQAMVQLKAELKNKNDLLQPGLQMALRFVGQGADRNQALQQANSQLQQQLAQQLQQQLHGS